MLNVQKLEFETNKKELERVLEKIRKEIEDSNLDVIIQGASYGLKTDESLKKVQDPRTAENLNKIKKILDYQGTKMGGSAQNRMSKSTERQPNKENQYPQNRHT